LNGIAMVTMQEVASVPGMVNVIVSGEIIADMLSPVL
jgi:hypothetical protein